MLSRCIRTLHAAPITLFSGQLRDRSEGTAVLCHHAMAWGDIDERRGSITACRLHQLRSTRSRRSTRSWRGICLDPFYEAKAAPYVREGDRNLGDSVLRDMR
mmetsp:Transcript_52374/g.86870  ORF Transcript_52374/g.86870 Transcript_52374/m.86870 type:complete len:102 (-) Transcript_52374:1-306(-)